MGALSRWSVLHPVRAITAWVVLVLAIGVLGTRFAGEYNDSFSLPDTESTTAQNLLAELPGAGSATGANAKVVFSPSTGQATEPAVVAQMSTLVKALAAVPAVGCVQTPFGPAVGTACPPSQARMGAGQTAAGESAGAGAGQTDPAAAQQAGEQAAIAAGILSPDGTVGVLTVSFKGAAGDVPNTDAVAVLNAVKAANGASLPDGATLAVGANGSVLEFAGTEPPSSEGIGIAVALVILLFAFGSIVGAILPILTAVVSMGVGLILVAFVARFLDVATFAPTLAAMIGLGVGIDYSLFVINRYKQALDHGREPQAAALESVRTAGRAVVFAAVTVVIALLGLFVMRINFFNGLAVAAAATVIMVMIGATFLLPAVLSLLGRRAFALRMPWARTTKSAEHHEGRGFARYGRWLQRHHRVTGAVALLVVVVIALPVLSIRLGFADDSGKTAGSPARIAYDLQAKGFGPGSNGPFFVVADLPKAGDVAATQALVTALAADPGVAGTRPTAQQVPLAMQPTATVTAIEVIPTTAPQDEATTELLKRLRTDVIPPVAQATGLKAYIGGFQAVTEDFTQVLASALPIFLLVVVGLGFLALMVLFRSLVVPLTAAITSLLSLGAALGVTVAVFQWGWLADVLGVASTGPIMPFLPVMVFAILFGLSMDYQVFLVSRMQEEWVHTGDNRAAVRRGLAGSGRVVAMAGAIMTSVFAAFILGSDSTIKLFGLSLSVAVLIDAFIVRLVIVPSLMTALGTANWYLPRWLANRLPKVEVEGSDEIEDIEDIEGSDDPRDQVTAGA